MNTKIRPARSITVLLGEVNEHAPSRNERSDGGLGDPAHSVRVSDHNPNAAGVYRAYDFTHVPKDGFDAPQFAKLMAGLLGKHPALMSGAYIIFNRQIISYDRLDEGWRPYDGANAHRTHVHVSVSTAPAGYDSTKPFNLYAKPPATPNWDEIWKRANYLVQKGGSPESRNAARIVRNTAARFSTKH